MSKLRGGFQIVERRGHVLILTLAAPERANSLSEAMLTALQTAILDAGKDKDVRAVVLAAQGRVFCAGHDLRVVPVTGGATARPLLGDLARIENATIVGEYDRVNGQRMVTLTANTAGEDFGRFAAKAPRGGVFVSLGVTPPTKDWKTAATNHSPLFEGDDAALPTGMRVMAGMALEYLRFGRVQ